MSERDDERMDATESGSPANSGAIKKIVLVGALAIFGYIAWGLYKKGQDQEVTKTDVEKQLDSIKAKQNQKVNAAVGGASQSAPTLAPQGDSEAQKLLQEVQARKEAELQAAFVAEEQAQMAYEELNYQRKVQVLPHDAVAATAWENRLKNAQATGQGIVRRDMTEAEEKLVREKNPQLYAKLVALRGQNAAPGRPAGSAAAQPAGGPLARLAGMPQQPQAQTAPGSGAPGSTPPSIDPRTGLPVSAAPALPESMVSGLLPDGTPDIEGGAIPVQMTYVPMGAKDPVTVTRWVKPGYLIGRVRPYSPQELMEADKAWRMSLRASSEVEIDKNAIGVRIPHQPVSNRQRVDSEWRFQQRYVVVLPNPKGVMTPPNPPQPTSGSGR